MYLCVWLAMSEISKNSSILRNACNIYFTRKHTFYLDS